MFQSESALNFQQYDNEIEVNDLDATADVSSKNKFGKHEYMYFFWNFDCLHCVDSIECSYSSEWTCKTGVFAFGTSEVNQLFGQQICQYGYEMVGSVKVMNKLSC